ncbi:MAG: hypothetical protein SOW50_06665 [Lachnospiraceae bacterium]|nr:hypothetical protein [Lachnospiraceae bacterium]
MERHDAIMKVIDECIKADIFKEVLQKYREEILRMSFWEFDEEEYKEYLISEERENTERERKRADEAEARADEAEARADEAESRAERMREEAIRNTIAAMRDANIDNETIRAKMLTIYPACDNIVDKYLGSV